MRAQGLAALHFDSNVGPEILSGITTSLTNGQKNINRRRMADFIEDSVTSILMPFVKLPLTRALIDTAQGQIDNFLAQLLSPNNPSAQRIAGYSVDPRSGNTQQQLAAGVWVVKVAVQMLPTADFIVQQTDVGPGVVITATVGGGGVSVTSV
jgi:phage tail sheath protein FI